jgi:hypothetical protein
MLYYYLCAAFTLISAAVSFGFSIESYVKSKYHSGMELNNAKYAVSRSFALLAAAIGLLVFINASYLNAISLIMIAVQLLDGIIGIKINKFKTFGPLLTAVCNAALLALFWMNH